VSEFVPRIDRPNADNPPDMRGCFFFFFLFFFWGVLLQSTPSSRGISIPTTVTPDVFLRASGWRGGSDFYLVIIAFLDAKRDTPDIDGLRIKEQSARADSLLEVHVAGIAGPPLIGTR